MLIVIVLVCVVVTLHSMANCGVLYLEPQHRKKKKKKKKKMTSGCALRLFLICVP